MMAFIDRIEVEFNEPFTDVLQGFADMGYGCNTTARMLNYNISNFRRLLKRHSIEITWPDASDRAEAFDRNPWPGCQRMIEARRAMCTMYTHPETGESLIASRWAERLGISVTQFLRRVNQHGVRPRVFLPNLRRST